jgi:hypothetical protein
VRISSKWAIATTARSSVLSRPSPPPARRSAPAPARAWAGRVVRPASAPISSSAKRNAVRLARRSPRDASTTERPRMHEHEGVDSQPHGEGAVDQP